MTPLVCCIEAHIVETIRFSLARPLIHFPVILLVVSNSFRNWRHFLTIFEATLMRLGPPCIAWLPVLSPNFCRFWSLLWRSCWPPSGWRLEIMCPYAKHLSVSHILPPSRYPRLCFRVDSYWRTISLGYSKGQSGHRLLCCSDWISQCGVNWLDGARLAADSVTKQPLAYVQCSNDYMTVQRRRRTFFTLWKFTPFLSDFGKIENWRLLRFVFICRPS